MGLDTPAFLLLKLRSIDDDQGAIESWRGLVGSQQSLGIELTLHYDARILALPQAALLPVDLGNGVQRLCVLLSVEPAPDAVTTALAIRVLDREPAQVPNRKELYQDFKLRCCAERVRQSTPSNVRFIPN